MNLSEKFNLQDFTEWIEAFLPEFSLDLRKVDVPSGFSDAKSIDTLGESSLGVKVFVIETDKDPAGRKIGLAKESFNLIKNYGTPNALIAYYSRESSKWRLSLLTSSAEWSEGKIITKLSSPKRQSYVLGPQSKVNTPSRFLLKNEMVSDIADLKSRFSLEVVNKEFYKEISESFIKLVGGTHGSGRNQKKYEAVLKLPFIADQSQTCIEFSVRLIGRIIFCWFLREKKSADGASLMPKVLLSLEAISRNSDYYHNVLEPIFFEILNQQMKARKDPFYDEPYSLIPYLNGGLFSPHEDDFYKRNNSDLQSQFFNTVLIPDEWFVELFETLEAYNFTIDENTSFDEELSIDPEMLGRIFENLLAEINPETGESARKSTGSYYTPRVIVEYMVDESLLLYLKQQTGIEESKLQAIISYDMTDDTKYPLNDAEKQKTIDALEKIKILDPACGSGAFPIGALQKMVFILQQIDPAGQLWFKKQLNNADPEFKRDIERRFTAKEYDYIRKLGLIRKSIYGIDIQPIATEISRLRCFLTLVVDQNVNDSLENRGIRSLPNLEFKFVTANSLIFLPKREHLQPSLIEDYDQIDELKEIRDLYFDSTGAEREMQKASFYNKQTKIFKDLKREHGWTGAAKAELTDKLTDWDPFSHKASDWFDPEWMFGIKEGFNIIVANPPYIEFKKLPREDKDKYKNFRSAKGKYDIYVLFIELALNLLSEMGTLCFINPTTFLQKDFGFEIRKTINSNFKICNILDFNDFQVFSSVTNYTGIFIFQKSLCAQYDFSYHRYNNSKSRFDFDSFSSSLKIDESYYFKQFFKVSSSKLNDKVWQFNNESSNALLKKISDNSSKLKDFSSSIFQGIASGKDEVFYVNENTILAQNLESSLLHPLLKGKDIKAYKISWSGTYVIYTYDGSSKVIPEDALKNNFPNIYKYLLSKKNDLSERDYFNNSGKQWYELWNQRKIQNFSKLRIVTPEISDRNNFVLTNYHFGNTKTYHILLKNDRLENIYYILGILNSKVLDWYYKKITTPYAGGFYAYKTQFLQNIPIKYPDDIALSEYVHNVRELVTNKNLSDGDRIKIRKRLDVMTYSLYELSPSEITVIESN